MRLEDLKVFRILADSRSFQHAGNRAGLTQSAVTKILQRLETEFGVPLILRPGQGIELTSAGRKLLERVKQVHHCIADIHAEMDEERSARAGRLRVGSVPALMDTVLGPLLGQFSRKHPAVTFEASLQVSSVLIEAVQNGTLDLALCFSSGSIPETLHADHLGKQVYHIVARRGHPLAQISVDAESLAKAKWLLPPRNIPLRTAIDDFFLEKKLGPVVPVVEIDTSAALFTSLLKESDLITFLTRQMLAAHLGHGLCALQHEPIPLSNDVRLIYRREAYLSPIAQSFRKDLHLMFESMSKINS